MNEVQAARWAKIRDKGRNRFIVCYGIIACGVLFTALFSIIELISNDVITPMYILMRFFVFSVIGIIVANKIWENKDRKFLEQSKSTTK